MNQSMDKVHVLITVQGGNISDVRVDVPHEIIVVDYDEEFFNLEDREKLPNGQEAIVSRWGSSEADLAEDNNWPLFGHAPILSPQED